VELFSTSLLRNYLTVINKKNKSQFLLALLRCESEK